MREVSVYLRGVDFLVTQHLLHGTQVGTVGDQTGCETVSETMWGDSLLDASFGDSLVKEHEDIVPREPCPQPVEEDIVFLSLSDFLMRTYRLNVLQ